MSNDEYQLRNELINSLAEQVASNSRAVLDAGFSDDCIEVLTHLTPTRRAYLHKHFFEMFNFEPGAYEKMKQRMRMKRSITQPTSYRVYIGLFFLLAVASIKFAYAELIVTPDLLSEIWYRDNKVRVAHNFMAVSDKQLAMQLSAGNDRQPGMMASMDFGKEDVLYPTTEGMRTGRIDGLSFSAVGYEYALFLERVQLSDNENHQSYPKDSWIKYSNYAGMATFHDDGWLFSAGILMKNIPVQRDNLFVNKSDTTGESESTELLLHLNYHGLQLSTYIDKDDAISYYSKYSTRLFEFWNNEIFYDHNRSEKYLFVGASKEVMWRTSVDITDNVKAGYAVRYSLDTDQVSYSSYTLGYKVFNAEYVKYEDNNPYRLDDYGYNVEIKLYDDKFNGLALGRRRNFSDHNGMFVNDYTITNVTFMLRF